MVVLVGPSGSGKSHWAAEWFAPEQVVASDRMRALVGESEHDQRAGTDAFAVLDLVLERRLRRRLFTVIDTLGLDGDRRRSYVSLARRHDLPVVAVAFDAAPADCRARNQLRARPVPAKVLAAQLRQWPAVRDHMAEDGFDAVLAPGPVRIVDPRHLHAPEAARRQREDPAPMEFGLQISSFTWPGGPTELAARLAAIARTSEDAGFTSISVMDHFVQIPQVGRHWEEMLDSWTALGFLAAHTSRVTLGTVVTGVTYRNLAHLGKLVATLDVLSGGRAFCGIGAAWYEREHKAYGWDFPPVRDRFRLLEDALRLLPLMWGPGAPSFEGSTITVPEAICYPRPLQEHVPILVGGGGEKRTLRLVAKYADACNLFGTPETVRHKVAVLHRHCAEVGRDPADVRITHLASIGTEDVEDHIGAFRELAEAGVQTAMVRLRDGATPEGFAPVIEAFRPR
ncbi:MAG: TIGR03560 family F420-dependent LLM class oxidoreductase [Acidimicrobiales bacterium]